MEASIDIGNTRIKIGLFDNGILKSVTSKLAAEILPYLHAKKVKNIIVSSVAGNDEITATLQSEFEHVIEFSNDTPVPLPNRYATPTTLGKDRLAAAVGALQYHSGPLLVIDAGSCITCDFINHNNEFVGGSISPGIKMRLQAMHTFTGRLPLLELEMPGKELPDSTREAMLTGAVIGAKHEIIGFINQYRAQIPEIKVILCGGDAKYFDKMNELNIFVLPNLVLEGLHAILRFNGEA